MNKKVWSPCCFVKSTEIKKAIANCTSLVLSDKKKKSALPKMYGKVQSCSAFNQRWCNIIVHDKNKTCSVLFSRHTTGVCNVQCKMTYKLAGVQVNISQNSFSVIIIPNMRKCS